MARTIRREHRRRRARAEARKRSLGRRSGLAAGVAAGAFALSAPSAQAVSNQVDSTADGPADGECAIDCTIRDALTLANASADSDTITFTSSLSGTIRLSSGVLVRTGNYDLTIDGPGAGQLAISGDGDNNGSPDDRVLKIADDNSNDRGDVAIEGLTLTKGNAGGGTNRGGAIYGLGYDSAVTLTNVTVSDSTAGGVGGGVYISYALTLVNTTVSGNESTGSDGGGIYAQRDVTVTDSTISGNRSSGDDGGGIYARGDLTVTNSTISGNTAAGSGGGIVTGKYLGIRDSVVSGNDAAEDGGGVEIKYSPLAEDPRRLIVDTTISGNSAGDSGSGLHAAQAPSGRVRIVESTISGNTGGPSSRGGGIGIDRMFGSFSLLNSTVSGNEAETGGGMSFGYPSGPPLTGDTGEIELNNSTIARNRATGAGAGGGLYLGRYNTGSGYKSGTVFLNSTLVGDNTAAGAKQDLDRADNSSGGGFDSAFSLIERRGDAPVIHSPPGSNMLGVDPKLRPLADNGGETMTHKPRVSSRAIDHGDSSRLATDQRGRPRRVEFGIPDTPTGNGTDIGSVELQRSEVPNERCAGKLATIIGDSRKINGTRGPDIISGTAGRNLIRGRAGKDRICGRGGPDRLLGGPGPDLLLGQAGIDFLLGGPGRDKLKGGPGRDRQRQ